MHLYSIPIAGLTTLGLGVATVTPAQAPYVGDNPQGMQHYRQTVEEGAPFRSNEYPGAGLGGVPIISMDDYVGASSGRGWLPTGTYRVDMGLGETSMVVRFGSRADGRNYIARQRVQHHPEPELTWWERTNQNVQREAARSVYEREQRWQGYRDTIQQFLPQSEPEKTYEPQAPYVPQPARSRDSGCHWHEGVQLCG